MNKRIFYTLVWTLVLFLGIGTAFGQNKVGTTSFQFLKVTPDARAAGMGEAFTSMVGNSQAVFWNPAGLAEITRFDAAVSQVNWLVDTKIFSLTTGYTLKGLGTIGAFAIVVDYGDIEVTEASSVGFNQEYTHFNPGLTGEVITPSAQVFGLSFARSLTDRFTFGLTAKYAREDLVRASAGKMVFDLGLSYKTGFKSIVLGAAVNNFGSDVRFFKDVEIPRYDSVKDTTYMIKYSGERYPLPQTFSFGVSAFLFSPENSLLMNMENQSLRVSYDMIQPRDYGQEYKAGLEYSWMNVLFLRGGYKFNFDEEGYTLGFGLNFKKIRFDYAYDPFGKVLEPVHRFSLGYSIN